MVFMNGNGWTIKGSRSINIILPLKTRKFSLLEVFTVTGQNKETGEELTTVSIVTTQANELMAEIHNSKHRMPVVLHHNIEKQ